MRLRHVIGLVACICMVWILDATHALGNQLTALFVKLDANKILNECRNAPPKKHIKRKNMYESQYDCLWGNIGDIMGMTLDEGKEDTPNTIMMNKAIDIVNAYGPYYKIATGSKLAGNINGYREGIDYLERMLVQLVRVKNGEQIPDISPGNYCDSSPNNNIEQKPLPPFSPLHHVPCLDYANYPMGGTYYFDNTHLWCLEEAVVQQAYKFVSFLSRNDGSTEWLTHDTLRLYGLIYGLMDKEKAKQYELKEVTLEYSYFIKLLEEMRYVAKTQGTVPPDWTPPFNRCNFMQFPSRAEELEKPVPFAPYHVQCKNSRC